ncbi:unnamed protein product, partial [Mesorhabditis spiculigera]
MLEWARWVIPLSSLYFCYWFAVTSHIQCDHVNSCASLPTYWFFMLIFAASCFAVPWYIFSFTPLEQTLFDRAFWMIHARIQERAREHWLKLECANQDIEPIRKKLLVIGAEEANW